MPGIERQVFEITCAFLKAAASAGDIDTLQELQSHAEKVHWSDISNEAKKASDELRLRKKLQSAMEEVHSGVPHSTSARIDDRTKRGLLELRAIQKYAKDTGLSEIAELAELLIGEAGTRVSAELDIPEDWTLDIAEIGDHRPLLKKEEELEGALKMRIQEFVDKTYMSWGEFGKIARTRDRVGRVPDRLLVESVVFVQNAEAFVTYRKRRADLIAELERMRTRQGIRTEWDVKTAGMSLSGIGKRRENPLEPQINEYYMWHGTTPTGAEGITDSKFDLKKSGTATGSLFGAGIYFAESSLKADEYGRPDDRGWCPLLLCRVQLGNVKYCDAKSPRVLSRELEACCKPGGGFHSVLGDREKVNRTFREFIVFNDQQVYPEFIVWYSRKF